VYNRTAPVDHAGRCDFMPRTFGQLMTDISAVKAFLACETPDAWIDVALQNQAVMLIDHANCEKKAAGTALNLMFRYVDKPELLKSLAQLAREELLHFEQVIELLEQRGIPYDHLSPCNYAGKLRRQVRTYEPGRLIDSLIVGALIEARSCERFAKLAPHLDAELGRYYSFLLKSESRHFEDYLKLAQLYSPEPVEDRIELFRQAEKELILSADTEFRFHSGIPA